MADAAGLILEYPVVEDCAGSSTDSTEELPCGYNLTYHLTNTNGKSLPSRTENYVRLGVDFETCSDLCERLANYVSNVDNPYRGVDVDMNWNRCYCLFDDQPTCPQFLTVAEPAEGDVPLDGHPSSCSAYSGEGSGPVSHSRGDPGTYPYPVIRTSSGPTQLWDGTVSADSGVCVFIASHQEGHWGSDLTSLDWIEVGQRNGFGYPNPLTLYCQYNVSSAELPAFHNFTLGNPQATWGIHHGFCTL